MQCPLNSRIKINVDYCCNNSCSSTYKLHRTLDKQNKIIQYNDLIISSGIWKPA